ncbi:MAG: gliding motility-associated C-terminal domain-containing protein [Bacteroidales bacterium]
MIKKLITSVVFALLFFFPTFASHYMGGEIWWECLPNGKYKFHARLYQECFGIDYNNTETMECTNVPGITSFPMNLVVINDITPVCFNNPTFPHITCDGVTGSNQGGVREWVYESAQMNLPATPPPPQGWIFAINICNRNPCANIVDASQYCGYLRAIMYPYSQQSNYSNCWENSPKFIERPSTVICTGYPFSYNPNAYDPELDSLVYQWAEPWTDYNQPITGYVFPYTYNSPLPGPYWNPNNVPATVNPNTGEVSFTSFTSGAYVTVNKVSAYKCGEKVADIFREMQIVLLPCAGNDPPTVIIQYPNGDTLNNYIDTVFAGATVRYNMWAYDGQMLNDTFTPQNIKVTATGLQLGENGTSTTTGCLNPPCAQLYWGDSLNPLPLPALGVWALNTQFRWQTDCSHLATETGCGGVSNVYNFVIRTSDDYCPAPAIKWTTITIVVKNAIMPHPNPRCVETESNGNIRITYSIPDTFEIPNTWNAYLIYRSKNVNGPYTLIDSLKSDNGYGVGTTVWKDLTAHGNDTVYYYYMQTRSGCYGNYFSGHSDTISNILLNTSNPGGGMALNEWNAPFDPLISSSSGLYTVYRRVDNTWVTLNTTTGLTDTSPVTGCGYIKFRIGIADSSGCESLSNIDSALFQASTPPELRCISVETNGDVTVDFLPPADGSMQFFSAYLIYSAPTLAGPFYIIDSVTSPSLHSKTITALNANPMPVCIYMINRIDCDGYFLSEPTDTLKSIHLNITSVDPAHSNLTWNETHQPPLLTSSGLYDIYRSYPIGLWDSLTSTTLLSAFDSLTICNDTIPYKIRIPDESGCFSVSNIAKIQYYDDNNPPVPVMDTASVDSITGYTHISWLDNGPETQGYIIYFNENGIWTTLDTIWGNKTYYLDKLSPGNACDAPKSYVIAAFDSCWKTSTMSLGDAQNTLHIQITNVDPCDAEITLSWNPYQNMKDYLGGYRVFVSENGSPPVLLGTTTPNGPGLPAPTSFVHQNYVEGSYYCYFVQAFNSDGFKTSSSCNTCILATKPKQPKFIYNRVATVELNNRIKVKFNVDTSAYIIEYRIYRSTEKTGPYDLAGVKSPTYSPEMEFIDNNVNPLSQSYFYTVAVVDSCGNEVMYSDTARTILLTVEARQDFTNYLEWNAYEGWTWAYVKSYNIFRGIDGLADPIPIANVPGDTLRYIDDVSPYFETQGKFRYYIEALEGLGSLPFNDTSYSNRANDVQNSKIFIPNAFSPKGYNSIFKPISIYADKTDYKFMIYSRWGELLFSTSNPDEGWDGRFEGDYVPLGVYIYYVKFNTSEGKKFEKRSTVTVIK